MARTTAQGPVTPGAAGTAAPRYIVELATPADDPAIRALLRDQPLGGQVRLALTREPDSAIAAAVEGERHACGVVREQASGAVVALGGRSVRRLWVNGQCTLVGYLGLLRRNEHLPRQIRLLRDNFALLDAQRQRDEAPWDWTSIIADNQPARRLLERALPGLPVYEPLGQWVTLVLPVRRLRGPAAQQAAAGDLPDIAAALTRILPQYQLAGDWDEAALRSPARCPGLQASDFLLVRRGGTICATAAVWDQRSFKQAVVHSYAPALARWRTWINRWQALRGLPLLPAPGQALAMACLSHLAVDPHDDQAAALLLRAALEKAREKGLHHLVIGLAQAHPLLPTFARLAAYQYRSILYRVRHTSAAALPALDGRTLHVEMALL